MLPSSRFATSWWRGCSLGLLFVACSSGVEDLTFEALNKGVAGQGATKDPDAGADGGSSAMGGVDEFGGSGGSGGAPGTQGGAGGSEETGGVAGAPGGAGMGGMDATGGTGATGGTDATGGMDAAAGMGAEGGMDAGGMDAGGATATGGTGAEGGSAGEATGGAAGSGATCPTLGELGECDDSMPSADLGAGCPRFLSTCQRWTVVAGYGPSSIVLDADYAGLTKAEISVSRGALPSWALHNEGDSPTSISVYAAGTPSTPGTTVTTFGLWDLADTCVHSSMQLETVVLDPADCE